MGIYDEIEDASITIDETTISQINETICHIEIKFSGLDRLNYF